MKNHPIIFSTEMVKAILEGTKTQTRRVIKPSWSRCLDLEDPDDLAKAIHQCPYGKPGDLLCVRETWNWAYSAAKDENGSGGKNKDLIVYKASHYPNILGWKWRPSIFMPKWAARIWLKIENVQAG